MERGFILSLIFAAIIALFALNNSEKVLINLLFTKVEMSQAIIILISTLFGAIIAAIFAGVRSLKFKKEIKDLNRTVANMEESKNKLQSSFEELKDEKNRLEILVDSLEEDKESLEKDLENQSIELDIND